VGSCDVTHKTGSTQLIATLPEEDRAMTIGNKQETMVKFGHVVPEICSRRDMPSNAPTDKTQYSAKADSVK